MRGSQREAQNWRIHVQGHMLCPQCRSPKLPHFACPNCGFYKESKVYRTRAEIRSAKKETQQEQK